MPAVSPYMEDMDGRDDAGNEDRYAHRFRNGGPPAMDGEAANDGAGTLPLPPLEIRVTGEDGRVTRYTLGTAGRALAPGERFAFSSRLDLPKNGVRTVSVAFAE